MKNKQAEPKAKPEGVQKHCGFYSVLRTQCHYWYVAALLKAIALGGILFALNCAKHNKAVHQ